MVRFADDAEQLQARDVVQDEKNGLTKDYVNAMMCASRAPRWLQALGLRAMPLGLDLRGGLYLLYQVDVNGAVEQLLDSYEQDFRRALRAEDIPFTDITSLTVDSDIPNGLRVLLPAGADLGAVRAAISKVQSRSRLPRRECRRRRRGGLRADHRSRCASAATSPSRRTSPRCAIASTNSACPSPSCSGRALDRIVVQLPGVQNSAEVKDMLGKVATLEFRLVDPRPIPLKRSRAARRQDLRPARGRRAPVHAQARQSSSPATSS